MERIKLSKKGRAILLALKKGVYPNTVPDSDLEEFTVLESYGLVDSSKCKGETRPMIVCPRLTEIGRTYLTINPKLKNPSVFDDKKYVITTLISLVAVFLSIIAIIKK